MKCDEENWTCVTKEARNSEASLEISRNLSELGNRLISNFHRNRQQMDFKHLSSKITNFPLHTFEKYKLIHIQLADESNKLN
jgi:hypothetical protein